MNDSTKTYNGWTNYETWAVHLWLTNDESTYLYWREQAGRWQSEAKKLPEVSAGTWTAEQAQRFQLADQLKAEFEAASPLSEATAYTDLLNGAIEEVDWHEIAEAFLAEVREPPSTSAKEPAFSPGRFLVARHAFDALPPEEVAKALARHLAGDWGDVSEHDRQANDQALNDGLRLLSVYHTAGGTKFWIITEADRSATTVLLPEEY